MVVRPPSIDLVGFSPPPTPPGGVLGVPGGKNCDGNFAFPVDPSVPKYCHSESRNAVIRCQTALWSDLAVPASLRSFGFCT